MKHRKTQLAAAVGAALLVGGTAVQAQNLTVQLYGQVNRALMWADNGHQNRWFFVDGESSGTRFGIQGTSQITPGLRAGARFETEWQSNASDDVNFETQSSSPGLAERWFDIFIEGAWGRVNLGQGSGAADDASTIDLSGTALADGLCTCDWGGRIVWLDSTGAALAGSPRVGQTHGNQDFESRYDRVMYTTPSFGGFRAQVGTGQKSADFPPAANNPRGATNEVNEASIWYSGKLAGELQAAIGWSNEKSGTAGQQDNETFGGSVSWLSAAGFSVTVAYTQSDVTAAVPREGTHLWGKIGYKFGPHAVSVSYGQTEDQAAIGDEGDVIGVGWVWNPVRWAEFYAGYHLFKLDRPGTNPEDIQTVAIGTRLRF